MVNEFNPAKVAVLCFLFLVVFYFTASLDWAISLTFIISVYLFSIQSIWLFIAAFISFVLYLLLKFISLKVDIFGDLSISSYLLFTGGIITYFLQGQKTNWNLFLPFKGEIRISIRELFKAAGILVIIFLIYPLTNAYIAVITGYLVFLFIFKKNDGKYAFLTALFFLAFSPVLTLFHQEKTGETVIVFTYYFLVIGVIQEIFHFLRTPQITKDRLTQDKINDRRETGSLKTNNHHATVKRGWHKIYLH